MQQTSIYQIHKRLGAKLIQFGNWEMPLQYEGVIKEHQAVRESCGIFDVSHMGEIFVVGQQAKELLQYLTINDISKLSPGKGQYTAILNESGGIIDDLIVYQITDSEFLLCVNASNIDKNYEWIKKQSTDYECEVKNCSKEYSQIAVQGPKSPNLMADVFSEEISSQIKNLDYMEIKALTIRDHDIYIARTGYTGEIGYEIYLPNELAPQVWTDLLEKSESVEVKPIGLGARDTLRLEACYLLYGKDMDESVSPLEAGIGWAVDFEHKFIGKEPLLEQKAQVPRRMIAFVMEDKGIAREGMSIKKDGQTIGSVTSGSFLPTLEISGGLALVKAGQVKSGDEIEIDIRGKTKLAKVVKRPLYSAKTR